LTLSTRLPAHVVKDQLAQVSGPREAAQIRFTVEVRHLLQWEVNGEMFASRFDGPAGHCA